MSTFGRMLIVLSVVAAVAFPVLSPPGGRAVEAPSLVEQRFIEIPDSRIISLSPDGTAIVATSFGIDEICVYERESLAQRFCTDLAPLESGLRLDDIVWSPDSAKIVLAEQALVRFIDGDLWVLDAATGELTNLTDDGVNARLPFGESGVEFDEVFVDVDPAWLPDSSGVTFSRSTWRDGAWRGNTIETVPVTGGPTTLLTTLTTDRLGVAYFGMSWNADGSKLYYSINHPEPDYADNGIWRINADGSNAEHLIRRDPELGAPALAGLSPDGSTVLAHYFTATAQRGSMADHLYSLYDVATGELTPLVVAHPIMPELQAAWPASITPDGNYVLYTGRHTDPENQILIRPIAGGEEISLVPEGIPDGAVIPTLYATPGWSTDGSVLFQTGGPSTAILLTIAGVSGEPVVVTPITQPATPVADGPLADLPAGATVTVNDNDVPLRSSPGVAGQTVAQLAYGTKLTVIAPAVTADGRTWIPVTDPSTGTIGYIRVEFIDPVED